MPLHELGLILLAAAIHVSWNAAAKHSGQALGTLGWGAGLSALAVALGAAGGWVELWPPEGAWPWIAATIAVHGAYFLTLGKAYTTGDLSLVYPIARGGAVLLVALGGIFWLGERPAPFGIAGVATVCFGIAVIAGDALRHGRKRRLSVAWAAITALLIAAYSLIDKRALHYMSPAAYMFWMQAGTFLLLLPKLRRAWPQQPGWIVAVSFGQFAAYWLVLRVLSNQLAGYVVAAREVSVVFSLALGSWLFRERPSHFRIAGALLVALGFACFYLAR